MEYKVHVKYTEAEDCPVPRMEEPAWCREEETNPSLVLQVSVLAGIHCKTDFAVLLEGQCFINTCSTSDSFYDS